MKNKKKSMYELTCFEGQTGRIIRRANLNLKHNFNLIV